MMVTKVGPMQDSMASGSNPADAQGPGFALTDENQRPLFVFIFPTVFIMMLSPMIKSLISGGLGF